MTLYNYIYIIFLIGRCYDNYTYLLYFYKFLKFVFKKRNIKKKNIDDDYIIINIQSNNISKYDTTTAGQIENAGEIETK
jgi:hypothetical protein